MRIRDCFRKILSAADDILMSNHECLSCGKEISDGGKTQLCDDCAAHIAWLRGKTCVKCGDLLRADTLACDNCKDKGYLFLSNVSCCYYDDFSAPIVKGLKYNSKKYYAKHLAQIMADRFGSFEDIDLVTFVPMTNRRKRERGFNQSEEIAREVALIAGKPMLPLLEKISESEHQAGASQEDRLKNILGTFKINSETKKQIKNKGVLVVDDVFTTGATINECTRTLLKAKPKFVKSLTFAKTKFDIIGH